VTAKVIEYGGRNYARGFGRSMVMAITNCLARLGGEPAGYVWIHTLDPTPRHWRSIFDQPIPRDI
jgi:hypothetical protein